MPFTHYRTQGIFLKREDRGEADQLFTVFTKDYGKLKILGRAIRKIKSKLRSGTDLFYFSEIEFIQGKTYKTLTDAILIEKFKNIRNDPKKLEMAYEITDILDSLTGKEEKDNRIWELLLKSFREIENCEIENSLKIENCKLRIIYYYFLWNLFSILGFRPELYSCPVCGKKLLPETFWFLPKEGGIVCWKCLKKFSEEDKKLMKEITVDTVKVLRLFLSEEILPRIKITEETMRNLKEVSEIYLSFLKEELAKMEK
ncbi:DNA repair protein RecO [bacterium]|nr:DNA repair protein RecO [bacterium]